MITITRKDLYLLLEDDATREQLQEIMFQHMQLSKDFNKANLQQKDQILKEIESLRLLRQKIIDNAMAIIN